MGAVSIELTRAAARHIAHHLRWTWSREVASALPGGGTPAELDAWADRMAALPGERACFATADGVPAIMCGMIQQGHLATTWVAGTDRVDEIAAGFMRYALRLHRTLAERGVRRFQAYCLDGPAELFAWLTRLGYRAEGAHPGMGIHGETYISFGRVDDVHRS